MQSRLNRVQASASQCASEQRAQPLGGDLQVLSASIVDKSKCIIVADAGRCKLDWADAKKRRRRSREILGVRRSVT